MKNFKFRLLSLATLTLTVFLFSCSDDDEIKPITLKDNGNTSMEFTYPSSSENGYSYPLQGGDGTYFVKSNNNEVVTVEMISAIDLRIKVIGLGETTILISDNSQNTLTLDIKVDYSTNGFLVTDHDITIVGDNLTENEKKAIREKYLSEIPVKIGGGYKFIFTDGLNGSKAIVYTDTYGSKGIETTFEKEKLKNENYPEAPTIWGYAININNEKRTFYLWKYTPSKPAARKEIIVPVALLENITAKVQKEYPKAELVYTSQVITLK